MLTTEVQSPRGSYCCWNCGRGSDWGCGAALATSDLLTFLRAKDAGCPWEPDMVNLGPPAQEDEGLMGSLHLPGGQPRRGHGPSADQLWQV